MSEKILSGIEKRLDKALKKQVQNGLAQVFREVSCGGVAKEIKAGRKVTENAAFGIRMCVHPKVGPRYNPTTKQFYPQTAKGRRLEEAFIKKTNQMLETGGFRKMPSTLLSGLRKKDRAFARRVKKR